MISRLIANFFIFAVLFIIGGVIAGYSLPLVITTIFFTKYILVLIACAFFVSVIR